MKNFVKIILILLLFSSCSENLLIGTSSAEPDDLHYSEAMDALNAQDYDKSIAIITTEMSADGQVQVRSRDLLASAYAGKCGLNFIDYTDKLTQLAQGPALRMMMAPFVEAEVADPAYCKLALETLELIGPTESRTNNQNIFASITGMVLLGTALRTYTDIAPAQGDGTVDVDICSVVTDSQINDMILGFGFFNKNFTAVSSDIVGDASNSSFGEISAACDLAAGDSCRVTRTSDITPVMRDFFRDIANTLDYGVGNYDAGGDPMQIPNSCP